jgi:putative MFS transporter
VIGGWLDTERASAIANGLAEEAADLAAGQATLDNLAVFPAILIVLFGILYFTRGKWQPKAI